MVGNPYGGALPNGGNVDIMKMLSSIFSNMGQNGGSTTPGGFMSMKPQGLMSMMGGMKPQGLMSMMGQQPPQQQSQPQPQSGNAGIASGVNKVLDPNSQFMMNLLKKPNTIDPSKSIGTPISNTPSTNMQNNPFMQMPQT